MKYCGLCGKQAEKAFRLPVAFLYGRPTWKLVCIDCANGSQCECGGVFDCKKCSGTGMIRKMTLLKKEGKE